MLKVPIAAARAHVTAEFEQHGSVLAGSARSRCVRVMTRCEIDSSAPAEAVAKLARVAEATCYTAQALRSEVATTTTFVLNGSPLVVVPPAP